MKDKKPVINQKRFYTGNNRRDPRYVYFRFSVA